MPVSILGMKTHDLITRYYDRFNAKDVEGFLELLTDDVVHEISQGESQPSKETFREFLHHMNQCYDERAYDIAIMVNQDGSRAAAEFMLDGKYLVTDGTLPDAHGQPYTLRVGAFFEIRDGKVARIANHYNIKDWLKQIS
jgi:steroid delta-isomerase-like uncharacterized protein